MARKWQAYIVWNLSYNHEAEQHDVVWSDVKQSDVTFSPALQSFKVSPDEKESNTPI